MSSMSYREIVSFYLDEKDNLKKAVRNGIILLSILVGIVLFSIFGPSHVLLISAIAWAIGTILFINKNRKGKKIIKSFGDDTIKRIDDSDKYT